MLELLITYLQATFKNSFPGIADVMGLAEKIQEAGKEFPAFYCTKDEYKPVSGSENRLGLVLPVDCIGIDPVKHPATGDSPHT